MLIRSVKLTNFLSFGAAAQEVSLQNLNVLIGPNGSGKSNFIEAMSLLRSTPTEVTVPVREGGGVRDWIWKGAPRSAAASIEAVVDYPGSEVNSPLRYRLSFVDAAGRLEVTDERIENSEIQIGYAKPYFFFGYEGGRPMLNVARMQRTGGETDGPVRARARSQSRQHEPEMRALQQEEINPQASILAQRRDPIQYPEITYLANAFSRIRLYREWSSGRYTPPRLPQPADLPNDFLMDDSRNLGLVLNQLKRDPGVKRSLLNYLKTLYSGLDDLEVSVEGGTVQIFLQEGNWPIPATRLSDGTLRYLSLLAVLCHPSPPPLVCIEEPEVGLHPDVVSSLARLLLSASERTQIIVTTHSDVLVDALTEHPEVVLVCERSGGHTELSRLSEEKLRPWLAKYRLGELYTRGDLGGTRY